VKRCATLILAPLERLRMAASERAALVVLVGLCVLFFGALLAAALSLPLADVPPCALAGGGDP